MSDKICPEIRQSLNGPVRAVLPLVEIKLLLSDTTMFLYSTHVRNGPWLSGHVIGALGGPTETPQLTVPFCVDVHDVFCETLPAADTLFAACGCWPPLLMQAKIAQVFAAAV